ncbi:hypothetical protein AAFF_G00295670 [Aldrovandia affinis]|uniref:Uncharacterized protein n=1 Tax=Aldrovandia affinis TaxID=143900 RepID=A0AAD7SQ89_9TELE|nr:hypothetical protein AAFF_G00295670 [Aldrovandia affinis]
MVADCTLVPRFGNTNGSLHCLERVIGKTEGPTREPAFELHHGLCPCAVLYTPPPHNRGALIGEIHYCLSTALLRAGMQVRGGERSPGPPSPAPSCSAGPLCAPRQIVSRSNVPCDRGAANKRGTRAS